MRNGDVDALEIRDVPPAALDLAINPWIRKEGRDVGVAAAIARILVVEDGARVGRGADEREGEDDGLEHLWSLRGNKQVATKVVRAQRRPRDGGGRSVA